MSISQRLNNDASVEDLALGIVGLKGKCAPVKLAIWPFEAIRFGVIRNNLVIDLDDNLPALDYNMIVEPFAILGWSLEIVFYSVETAGLLGVLVGVVNLGFIAFSGPAFFLEPGVKVDAGVGSRSCHDLGLQFKVLKGAFVDFPSVEKVTAWSK